MARCKCGCGREVATPATGRPGEYSSASCRKRAQRQRERAMQLELLPDDVTKPDEDTSTVMPDVTKLPEETSEVEQDGTLDLLTYSRESLRYQGPHDQARRAWLRTFAEQGGYRDFWFTMHGQYSGYYQTKVLSWTRFLEGAVQYEIYCCYVAAVAPGQLERRLTDAAKRGEIKL